MDKKITIGLFNDSFFPMIDGVVMVVDNYARILSKYANVIVFVPDYKDNSYDDLSLPYKVVRCKSFKVSFLDYIAPIPKLDVKFKKELKKYKLDIVHIHSPFMMGKMGLDYAKKNNIPCIATMHSRFRDDIKKLVKSEKLTNIINKRLINVFNRCDECYAVNKEVGRIYHEDYGYKEMPKVTHNATNMEPIIDKNEVYKYVEEKHQIKANEKVFLFVGRINTLKNILFIVDSLKLLKEKRPSLKFKMIFIGSGRDKSKLRYRIKKNKLEDNIIVCSKITNRYELASYYKRADLFLFPSWYDCSSLVQIEAASQSTPTVFLKNTPTSSMIKDNVNGFLSDNSVDAYSDKIIEVLENKELYEEVSQNAFRDLYKSWDEIVDSMYQKYLKIIKNHQNK